MKQESSAINPYNGIFGQQGWICPKCGRVYSPYTQMCLYCKPDNITTVSNLSDLSNKNVSEEELRENRKNCICICSSGHYSTVLQTYSSVTSCSNGCFRPVSEVFPK